MLNNIALILVNPSHPGNIGAVARAMKNMQLNELRLVKPKRIFNEETFARSAGAEDILNKALFFDTFEEAIADCHYVYGTSARPQVPDIRNLPLRSVASDIVKKASSEKVALVFGREHAGLTNEELALCQQHIFIPANPNFSSLNLGTAVQVVCYEVYVAAEVFSHPTPKRRAPPATQEEITHLQEHLKKTLAALDFYDPENPRRLMEKLRAMINRTELLTYEVAILRGILTAVDQKIR